MKQEPRFTVLVHPDNVDSFWDQLSIQTKWIFRVNNVLVKGSDFMPKGDGTYIPNRHFLCLNPDSLD